MIPKPVLSMIGVSQGREAGICKFEFEGFQYQLRSHRVVSGIARAGSLHLVNAKSVQRSIKVPRFPVSSLPDGETLFFADRPFTDAPNSCREDPCVTYSSFPPPIASPILPLEHASTEAPKSPFATTTQPTQAPMLPYFGGGLSRAWRWNA